MLRNTRPRSGKLNVDLGSPEFTIQLKPPDSSKEEQPIKIPKHIVGILLVFALITGSLLWIYVYPQNRVAPQPISPTIRVSYTASKYISVGDKNNVQVSVINLSPEKPFSGTVTLKFSYSAVLVNATSKNGMSIFIKDLPPGDRVTNSIEFQLLKRPTIKHIDYYFQVTSSDNSFQSTSPSNKFLVMPFLLNYSRTILKYIFSTIGGTSILSFIINLFWERIKKYLSSNKRTNSEYKENQLNSNNVQKNDTGLPVNKSH